MTYNKVFLFLKKATNCIPFYITVISRGRDSQGEEVMRSYTPITLDSDIGYFELVVKVQFFFCGQIFAKRINEFIFSILI